MRKPFPIMLSQFCLLTSIIFLLPAGLAHAQQTNMSDFVLFGGNPAAGQTTPPAPGYGVQLGSSSSVSGGAVGSYSLVTTTGNANIAANIYSGGTVQLANGNTVTGRITAANAAALGSTVLSMGSNASIGGNIDVNGNIVIGGGTVSGKVTHPAGTSYSGPAPAGGNITGVPALPALPLMPVINTFPPAGTSNITSSQTISPGAYGDVTLGGNATLTFSGTGTYIFKSIKNSGTANNLVFDFRNDPMNPIKIYVYGDVDLNKSQSTLLNGGSASRIYAETHGTGSTSATGTIAWNMANGSSGQGASWMGSIWAPYAAINVGSGTGSSNITGALWSGTQVNIRSGVSIIAAPFMLCNLPDVHAGPDKPLDFLNQTTLTGTSATAGASLSWRAINGGVITSPANTAQITVSSAGTYILTAIAGSCAASDTVIVTGKVNNLIGSELQSVYQNFTPNSPPSPFFVIHHDSIFIDIIVKSGMYNNVLTLLTSPTYGLTNLISNGASNYIITGLFPIAKLPLLNGLGAMIVYCRPYYTAFNNAGIVTSAGDTSVRSYLVRRGYGLTGNGVKVGVISNSYNTITAATTSPLVTNTAAQDVVNGDLPGPGNPDGYTTPVHVLKDYPYQSTDEGRGMLQIVHDLAPGAELYFRTGAISPGDFAQGIQELQQAGCNVIVDDVTYMTEPFLKDGVVAAAVDQATAAGVSYFSAAGNFAGKSYENVFNPVPAPGGLPGNAHNFSGGDMFQNVTLSPGNYTIVLQWVDDIYSLGQTTAGGTQNDLDIYLTPNRDGTALFGFNRNNINGDPIEVLPFTLTSPMTLNLLITNNTVGGTPVRFKYIVFRGDIRFNNYATGTSTIIGQANAQGAIAVGAARYDKAPPYPGPLTTESFSSLGGTVVNSQVRNKPNLVAPDGVNTTVNLGIDYDHDSYSNFFGTSAAAPHAAAVAALIMEGKRKFANQPVTSPTEMRNLLQSSATDMNTPGFDLVSGYGFINADSAMRTFAKPNPSLIKLVVPTGITPGTASFTLTVTGLNLSSTSVVKFRDSTLGTTILNSNSGTAVVPAFIGNPIISVYTPPVSASGLDGGTSDTLRFFSIPKKNITIIADNKTIKYGQQMPALTATVLVNGDTLKNTTLTLADLGLQNLGITTPATAGSNVGTYLITPSRIFDKTNPVDVGLQELYNYTFVQGKLTIQKLPVTITAQNSTVNYGQRIPNIQFTYKFDGSNMADSVAFLNTIKAAYQSQLAKDASGRDILGLVNGQAVAIVNGEAVPIVNGQAVTIVNGQAVTIVNGQAVPIVNGQAITIVNGFAVPIVNSLTASQIQNLSFQATAPSLQNARVISNKNLVNGVYQADSTRIVDITQESILNFGVNSAQTQMLTSLSNVSAKGLVDAQSIANGFAVTIVNGQAVTIVNGQAVTIVNGQAVTIVNGQAVTIVNGQAIPIVNSVNRNAVIIDSSEIGRGQSALKSVNMITGFDAGSQFIIPGSLVNDNLQLTYIAGTLTVVPAPVTITPAASQAKVYGSADPVFTYTNNASLAPAAFTGAMGRVSGENAGSYAYTLGTLSAGTNYTLSLTTVSPVPLFTINPQAVTITPAASQAKVFGSADPVFSYTNNAALAATAFTGALGRVSGENAGSYAYALGTLSAGTNYTLSLSAVNPVPVFVINPKPVIITPVAGQTKVYGNPDPVFSYTNNAALATTAFTGALGRAGGENVGSYAYTLGTISAGGNYLLSLAAGGSFAISQATLQVKARDTVIIAGNPLPAAFAATMTGLKNGDNPAVSYTVSPVYAGGAGIYSIVPVLNNFANAGNYIITYVNGTLYVNPGPGSKKLRPSLDCVVQVTNPLPGQYAYVAHFVCINDNATPVYLPIGPLNNIASATGGFDASAQTALFMPGTTRFNVPFDGNTLTWTIINFDSSGHKTAVATNASSTSSRCSITSTARVMNTTATAAVEADPLQNAAIVYPNPARLRLVVHVPSGFLSDRDIMMYTTTGAACPVKMVRRIAPNSIELDVSRLPVGFYIINCRMANGARVFRFIKG